GQAKGIVERVSAMDAAVVDAETGEVHLRPSGEVIAAYSDKVRFRAKRHKQYEALRDRPAVTRDGARISLNMNAGLLVDMPHLAESGADGIGLFRTELQFMLSQTFPRLDRQIQAYKSVLKEACGKPVVFRSLDIGGDKSLPYLKRSHEENPALGWRAIRMSLDRTALFRTQVRAFIRAAEGADLRIMIPMVSASFEIDAVRALVDKEIAILARRGYQKPRSLKLGAMIEVPSVLFELDQLLPKVDFASVGSNDLMQFMFAADRGNALVAKRYDPLSPAPLRALKTLVRAAKKHKVPLNLCGEMAGRPIEAMALIGLGFRSISMAPASIGPVKSMILALDAGKVAARLDELMQAGATGIRGELKRLAEQDGIEL
ncbi:MAG: putative PEP-binding protein, partial [Hyphomicrobium sp.]